MDRIILNGNTLKILMNKDSSSEDNSVSKLLIFKETYKNGFRNFFFAPNIGIKLYSPKVSWLDSKGISFCFDKHEYISLLELLKYINKSLEKVYTDYKKRNGLLNDSLLSPLYYEKGNFFYVKCHLPNVKGKYFITYNSNTEKNASFSKPMIGCVYSSIIIDIRNVWETDNKKAGVHLELKEVNNFF